MKSSLSLRMVTLVICLAIIQILVPKANAQSGAITGIISDSSSSAISGASVTAVNTETGVSRKETTNDQGIYSISLLPQGIYTVSVTAAGFDGIQRTQLRLDQAQVLRLDLSLTVGSVATTVQVSAQAPALDQETTSLSTVLEKATVVNLPLNGRNVNGLINLVPGVVGSNNFGAFDGSAYGDSRVSIGGGTPSSNSWQIDGTADENHTSGGAEMVPSPDATEEIRIITRDASAEYGRLGGGAVDYITKSGTNEYHGSLWDFVQNNVLNANNYFTKAAGQPIAPYSQNQYGATFGGPIIREKTFFFANWEGFRQFTAAQAFYTVPTDLQKQGDFSQTYDSTGQQVPIYDPLSTAPNPASPGSYIRTAFPNNKIPADRLNPVAAAIATYYPEPNLAGDPYTGIDNFFGQATTSNVRNNMGLRVDDYLTPARQLAARYIWDRDHVLSPQYYGADNPGTIGTSATQYLRDSALLSYSDALRSNLLIEARAGFNRFGIDRIPVSTGFNAAKLGFPESLNSEQQFPVFPYFSFSTTAPIGSTPGDAASQRSNTFSVGSTITWVKGRHNLKAGFDGRLYEWNSIQGAGLIQFSIDRTYTSGPNPNVAAVNGYDFASFMLGYPTSGTLYRYQNYEYSTYYEGAFVQDDWKITSRLTANLGLRYDHEGATTARHNNIANFDPNLQTTDDGVQLNGGLVFPGVNGLSRGNRNTTFLNFGPRVGLAYQAAPKMVVRAAFSVFYLPGTGEFVRLSDTGFSSQTAYLATTNGGLTPAGSLSNPFPDGIVEPTGSSLGPLTGLGTSITGNVRNFVTGTSEQYSANVQRQFGTYTLEIGYMGNHGLHLPADFSYDYLSAGALSQGAALQQLVPNPYAGIIHVGALAEPTVTRASLLTAYPQFTGVTSLSNWAGSNYQAGTIRLQHNYGSGLTFLASYTWSKLLDTNLGNGENIFADSGSNTVQNWGNLKAEKALSTSSQPQRLVISAGYALPYGRSGSHLYRALAGGWRTNIILSAESGDVIGVTADAPLYGGSRPNLVGNPHLSNPTHTLWLNRAAFQNIAPFTFGNSPRNLPNTFTQPLFNLDASLVKNVTFAERYRAEFRFEAFNATNKATFGNPDSNINDTNFGQITTIRTGTNPRIVQLGVKGYF
jgi:outer membrane receptor protein involved in Fe transport